MIFGTLSMRAACFALLSSAFVVHQAAAMPDGSSCGQAIPLCLPCPSGITSCPCVSTLSVGVAPFTRNAILPPGESNLEGSEKWFQFTVASRCQVNVTFNSCSTEGFDSDLEIYTVCGGDVFRSAELGCAESDDAFVRFTSVTSPVTYFVRVKTADGSVPASDEDSFALAAGVRATTTCGGDPHFLRWNHEQRDTFHGECDLVLLHSKSFHNSAGLDVHVRTTMRDYFSYIEAAAVRIGNTILEFLPEVFLLNGVEHKYNDVAQFKFEEGEHSYDISSSIIGHKRETVLALDSDASIVIRSTKSFMYVTFSGDSTHFGDSVGMLGEFEAGNMIGRHGAFNGDYIDYGFEWQVNSEHDPILFKSAREPQLPYEKCRMPTQVASAQRRRLRMADSTLYDQAKKSCQPAEGTNDFDLCVDDVMSTGDINMAEMFLEMH